MTLVGLDYLGKQEIARHNLAQEELQRQDILTRALTADKDRTSRESISSLDRASREGIADADRTSKEGIASADRISRENIASQDRDSRENIALEDRISRELISELDRIARTDIADKDRYQRLFTANRDRESREKIAEADREWKYYNTDAGLLGKNEDLASLAAAVVAKDRFTTGNYSSPGVRNDRDSRNDEPGFFESGGTLSHLAYDLLELLGLTLTDESLAGQEFYLW